MTVVTLVTCCQPLPHAILSSPVLSVPISTFVRPFPITPFRVRRFLRFWSAGLPPAQHRSTCRRKKQGPRKWEVDKDMADKKRPGLDTTGGTRTGCGQEACRNDLQGLSLFHGGAHQCRRAAPVACAIGQSVLRVLVVCVEVVFTTANLFL